MFKPYEFSTHWLVSIVIVSIPLGAMWVAMDRDKFKKT